MITIQFNILEGNVNRKKNYFGMRKITLWNDVKFVCDKYNIVLLCTFNGFLCDFAIK